MIVSCRGPTIAAGSDDGNVYALDTAGTLLWSFNTGARVVSVAMSECFEYVVAGSLNKGLCVFNNSAGTLMWSKPIPISRSYASYMGERRLKDCENLSKRQMHYINELFQH